ncbi:MAG: pilus assembly protein PilP [Deltaproteobacteria bacterium]|nr:pilus assembly protein PilP [Deltaproteobacteria bacterium]
MYKYIVGLIALALVGYIGYYYYTDDSIDSKTSIERNVQQIKRQKSITPDEELLLRLQLAVISFISEHHNPPNSLNELVPAYIEVVPKDPSTNALYAYRREGSSYVIGTQQTKVREGQANTATAAADSSAGAVAIASSDFVNPNSLVEEDYFYDPSVKRDPFLPFDFSQKAMAAGDIPPLERYKLGQLRLTAVISDAQGQLKGNVEDTQGKGYFVEVGTKIGDAAGAVIAVEKDKIIILETQRDIVGNESMKKIEMPIQKKSK